MRLSSLRGGNPKVVYINYKMAARRDWYGSMTSEAVEEFRSECVKEYDESPEIRARWARLFKMKLSRQKRIQAAVGQVAPVPAGVLAAGVAEAAEGACVVWAPQWPRGEPAEDETEQEQMPVSLELVAAMRKGRAPVASSLDAITMDASIAFRYQGRAAETRWHAVLVCLGMRLHVAQCVRTAARPSWHLG